VGEVVYGISGWGDCPDYRSGNPVSFSGVGGEAMKLGEVCEHGSLKRSCPTCEAYEDCIQLQQTINLLESQLSVAREALEKIQMKTYDTFTEEQCAEALAQLV
jgi:hypothetical protein